MRWIIEVILKAQQGLTDSVRYYTDAQVANMHLNALTMSIDTLSLSIWISLPISLKTRPKRPRCTKLSSKLLLNNKYNDADSFVPSYLNDYSVPKEHTAQPACTICSRKSKDMEAHLHSAHRLEGLLCTWPECYHVPRDKAEREEHIKLVHECCFGFALCRAVLKDSVTTKLSLSIGEKATADRHRLDEAALKNPDVEDDAVTVPRSGYLSMLQSEQDKLESEQGRPFNTRVFKAVLATRSLETSTMACIWQYGQLCRQKLYGEVPQRAELENKWR